MRPASYARVPRPEKRPRDRRPRAHRLRAISESEESESDAADGVDEPVDRFDRFDRVDAIERTYGGYGASLSSRVGTGCGRRRCKLLRQTVADIVTIVVCLGFLVLMLNHSLEQRGTSLQTVFWTAVDKLSKQTFKSDFLASYPVVRRLRNRTMHHLAHLSKFSNKTVHHWTRGAE